MRRLAVAVGGAAGVVDDFRSRTGWSSVVLIIAALAPPTTSHVRSGHRRGICCRSHDATPKRMNRLMICSVSAGERPLYSPPTVCALAKRRAVATIPRPRVCMCVLTTSIGKSMTCERSPV